MDGRQGWVPGTTLHETSGGYLLFFNLNVTNQKPLYEQIDSPQPNLRRDSAELYVKDVVPALSLTQETCVHIDGGITNIVSIRDELMVSTKLGKVLRYRWNSSQNLDYCLDLKRIPFCIDQQVSKAIPIVENNVYVVDIEYSPLVGGFAIVLNDGRAAFLTASTLKFDPNQVQGIWAQGIEDANCASVNHKFRLIAFGRNNSQGIVYCIDESTGALEVSHQMILSSKDYPGEPGGVRTMNWTPDGCAIAVAWTKGGLSLWSTFGALLMCTLGWDYGINVDICSANPLIIKNMEWSTEGYQLWLLNQSEDGGRKPSAADSILQLDFVKSALTVNPCMSYYGYLYLQGADRLYISLSDGIIKSSNDRGREFSTSRFSPDFVESNNNINNNNSFQDSKQWIIVPLPATYSSTNWPMRYTAIDSEGQNVSVAGRTGLAHYSLLTRKWKLFGNETQEKDFVVAGGLLWWNSLLVMGSYSIIENRDELRFYPRDTRLDNAFMKSVKISAPLLLLNILKDKLITFGADSQINIYNLSIKDNDYVNLSKSLHVNVLQSIDIGALCVHPACVVYITLTLLRTETSRHTSKEAESIVLNISGRLLMVQRELRPCPENERNMYPSHSCGTPTVLASCVENVWLPRRARKEKPHLTEAIWLFCGAHGMRVWLPLFPRDSDKAHTFMSKRIMLPFQLKIYPLAILFEEAILLGAANDTSLYTSDKNSIFSLPFCILEKTSQVYLHQILRQLIRRNLGFHAWEIARSCTNLPYFPHSLELLLHEVLEEEATSKEPIPDALLPSVIEFIQEFPVYLQTVVQCARKTEIALWPYLFSAAGKPKELFQECMSRKQLDTAASYLIILQNLEPSSVSRQYATLLLDAALENCKWELSKDLVRFLRAIDPNDVESPRASFNLPSKYGVTAQTSQLKPNEEDLSLVLGTMQVSRTRSYSTTVTPKVQAPETSLQGNQHKEVTRTNSGNSANDLGKTSIVKRKKSVPAGNTDNREPSHSAEEFFIDVILQRHARRLLSAQRLLDLGHFAAHLDFHPVSWLSREKDRAARVEDFVGALKHLHSDFGWPYPVITHPNNFYLQRKTSNTSSSSPALSPLVEDRIKGVNDLGTKISQVGDSGYVSHPGGIGLMATLNNTPSVVASEVTNSHMVVEAHLMPHLIHESASIMSEESSVWTDDRDQHSMEIGYNDLKVLEQLSQEVANRGNPKSEIQLRYLLQLLMEASCLEWSVIVAILLHDAMAVLRAVNAARSMDQSMQAVQRLRDGILSLFQWTNTQCLGYKPFMVTIQNQISVLNKILLMKEHQERQTNIMHELRKTPPGKRSRKTSSNQESTNILPNLTHINNDTCDLINIPSKGSEEKSNKSCKSNGRTSENGNKGLEVNSVEDEPESPKLQQQSSQCVIQ
ncbi:hypothetical protein RUM43_004217 [Polyplax serrata]|uniref:Protein RIC1 homolog n=1 Tax=Polyplax serrata TaxID=468196 RepID=A0AAN8XLJ9_POLSC